MKRGWWDLTITETDDGFEPDDLDIEHIAEMVRQGFTSGQLIHDEDEIEELTQ